MNWDQILRASGLDRYDRNASLYPAFLSLLPIFVVVALWMPDVWTLLGGLVSIAVGCGLIFLLAQIVRYLGRRMEARLGDRVGRARSAAMLSHSDTHVAIDTKLRYHRYLSNHGIRLPDREMEANDPAAAKQAFRSAVDWLLEHTRPNAKALMLHNENIAYGFRRNLLGMKPMAITLVVIALAGNAFLIFTKADHSLRIAGGIVELFLLLTLIAWLLVVRAAFVEDASLAYAQRFLAQCEDTKPGRKLRKAKAES